MKEILFITNDQSLLKIIDQLKALVDARIDIVNDFSQGLKEIFFRHPVVVFIQTEIGGITGEKVASQVRALLDEEPIRLVLLHNKTNEWQVADSNFNGSIDISLPQPELIRQLQQEVCDALYAVQGKPAVAGEALQNDTEKVELIIESPKSVDEYKIDSLADIFPADLPVDWETPLPEYEEDAQTAAESVEPVIEPIKPGEEFSFETIPDSSLGEPDGGTIPPFLPENGQRLEPPWEYSLPGQDSAADNERWQEDVRPDDQEQLSHLSAGMSDETFADLYFNQLASAGAETAAEGGVSPETAPAFGDSPQTSGANCTSSAETAGYPESSPAMAYQAPTFPSAQKEAPPIFGGSASIQAGTGREHFGKIPPDTAFADAIPFREDFGKKSSLKLKVFIGALILIISLAAIFIARDWFGVPEQAPLSDILPPAPLPAPVRDLPAFIPGVTPDSAYAAAHPGWERREADGLEYLIYREKGRIKAIQVIAENRGWISLPFLKTCIRETTGREDADNWVREKRDDFMVEKGPLGNKGELAVYRKLPEGDIRGFVLTFH